MTIKIYAMTHKRYTPYQDPIYIPLQVGRAGREDLGYLGDDTGDNISDQNCYFAELTGVYWMWKNCVDADYLGVCHYRRYLVDDSDRILDEAAYAKILNQYDMITSKKIKLNYPYIEGFELGHDLKDLVETGRVIEEVCPEYYADFDRIIHGYETYFGNIMVTSRELFHEYAHWLFGILFEVQKRIDIEDYDDYRKRVFGFLSEILLYVWVTKRGLKVYECKVGIVGEKFETNEVKKTVEQFLHKADYSGAKRYCTEYLKKRPDILMEASDMNGELKLTMQAIATLDALDNEDQLSQKSDIRGYLDQMQNETMNDVIAWFRRLDTALQRLSHDQEKPEDISFIREEVVSATVIEAALLVVSQSESEREHAKEKITLVCTD